jgi:hypothetical protein
MHHEAPDAKIQGPLCSTAKAVVEWILEEERLGKGPWVAGIYGGRGSGKSSLLLKVLEDLHGLHDIEQKVMLPKLAPEHSQLPPTAALFAPTDTRDHDDLFFLLLQYMENFYEGKKENFEEAKLHEVRRRDFTRALEYDQDISPSHERMIANLVDRRCEAATSTRKLQVCFEKICSDYSTINGKKRRILFLVDDLDLKPERALELLDLVRLFLCHKGVIVLIAADKSLLVESIYSGLNEREIGVPGLASALLAKLIPIEWQIPTADEDERFNFLWNNKDARPELPYWWHKKSAERLGKAEIIKRIAGAEADETLPEDDLWASVEKEVSQDYGNLEDEDAPMKSARKTLCPFLPLTFRGLKAMHNRLVSLHVQYQDNKIFASEQEMVLDNNILNGIANALELDRFLVPSFLSILASIDIEYGELGLFSALNESPQNVADSLRVLFDPQTSEERDHTLWSNMVILDRLQEPWLAGRRRGQAEMTLRQLAELWQWWKKDIPGTTQVEDRFLAVSLNANAFERGRSLWSGRFDDAQVEKWHIDLRQYGEEQRASPEDLRSARARADERIRESGIADFFGAVELLTRAQIPLVCWLGWRLRNLRRLTAVNDFAGKLTPFYAPLEPLRYHDRGELKVLDRQTESEISSGYDEAILLIDLIGKSGFEHTKSFYKNVDSTDPIVGFRVRLGPQPGMELRITPDTIMDVLEDAYECIAELKKKRHLGTIHLGMVCPDVFAFFLGRELNAYGPIYLYEYYDDVKGGRYLQTIAIPD